MHTKTPPPGGDREEMVGRELQDDERSREAERLLTAIARAIAVGRLPPDDAFAWARIAASLVQAAPPRDPRARCRSVDPTTH